MNNREWLFGVPFAPYLRPICAPPVDARRVPVFNGMGPHSKARRCLNSIGKTSRRAASSSMARDRARHSRLQEPARHGLRAVRVRTVQRPGPARHDPDHDADDGPTGAGHIMKFWEDIAVGELAEVGRYTFSVDGIKGFARRFD